MFKFVQVSTLELKFRHGNFSFSRIYIMKSINQWRVFKTYIGSNF